GVGVIVPVYFLHRLDGRRIVEQAALEQPCGHRMVSAVRVVGRGEEHIVVLRETKSPGVIARASEVFKVTSVGFETVNTLRKNLLPPVDNAIETGVAQNSPYFVIEAIHQVRRACMSI